MKILMLYPKYPIQTIWNLDRVSRVIHHRRATMAPLGLLTVAAYLPDDFEVRLIDRNIREENEQDWEWADVIFLSLMLVQHEDYEACLRNARRQGKPVAVGGPYASALSPEQAAELDWCCVGEAESIMEAFVADLRSGRRGVVYQGGNRTELSCARVPRFDLLLDINEYYVMPIQFSRGCPFRCEFCTIIEIYGRVPRTKEPGQIVAEIDAIHRLGFTGCIFIVDDNFIGNQREALATLRAIAEWNAAHKTPYFYFTEATINLGDNVALLDAMAEANFMFVFIGIETVDTRVLAGANKTQNINRDMLERVRTIRDHGIHIITGMVVGFDGERRDIFEQQRAFLDESGIGIVMQNLLQALPGTRFTERLRKEGRLIENQLVVSNTSVEGINYIPKGELTKRDYLLELAQMYQWLYEPEAFFRRITPAHLALRRRNKMPLRLDYLWMLLRYCWNFGMRIPATRRPFWRSFMRVVRQNPRAIGPYCYDLLHYLHFYEHKEFVRKTLEDYVQHPDPGDILDQLVPSDVDVHSEQERQDVVEAEA